MTFRELLAWIDEHRGKPDVQEAPVMVRIGETVSPLAEPVFIAGDGCSLLLDAVRR